MTTSARPVEDAFPVFELGYVDSLDGVPRTLRSQQGKLLVRLADGAAFRRISLQIVSSAIPLKVRYRCLYKSAADSADIAGEASEGEECPRDGADYIKKIAFDSKIYYRCWLSGERLHGEFERDPAGAFWCYSGRFCGTSDADRWITGLEIKMPSLLEGWRAA